MNRRRIVLIVAAVVLALIGTLVVYSYISGADKRALNGVKAETVLVATKVIPAGTSWATVKAGGFVSSQSLPESSTPLSALTSTAAAVPADQQTTFAVQSGQVMVREMFAENGAPAVGALTIKKDLQAITIAVPSNAEVAGYVQPGSQVAVYTTLKVQRPTGSGLTLGTDQYVSKLLLARVDVLAVGPSAGSSSSSSGAGVMVTMAVNQKNAERILLAQQLGALYLTLLTGTSATAEGGGTGNFGFFNPSPLFAK